MTAKLPNTTEGIADWLGEPNRDAIAGIRAWHGDAAVVLAMEALVDVPREARAPAFFERISDQKWRRKLYGQWPATKFEAWRAK